MIISAIITIGSIVLGWIIELFPVSSGFGTEFHTAMQTLGGYLEIWKPILPISTLSSLLGLVIGVELAIFGFKTVKWIVSHVPYVGGKGN